MKKGKDNIAKPSSFCDYEKDHLLILSSTQNTVVSVFMAISNCSLTVALCIAIIKYSNGMDMTIAILITIAASFAGLVEKMLLGSIQRHDQAIILEYEINEDYIKNKEETMRNKEKEINEKHKALREVQSSIVLNNGKTVLDLKNQIHNSIIDN